MTDLKDDILDAMRLTLSDRLRKSSVHIKWLHQMCAFLEEPEKFQKAYDLLNDEESRRVYTWLLRFRVAAFLTQSTDEALKLIPPMISPAVWERMSAASKSLPESSFEGHLDIDLVECFILDGYRLPGICEVNPGDTVIDLGAFNGNSSIQLARHASHGGKIYAFEPNPITREVLERNLERAQCITVEIVPAGVSNVPGTANFIRAGAASRFDPAGDVEVPITTIDNFMSERPSEVLNFLKIDIEGFEMSALRGAVETIRRYRPKIAVCIYHLHDDMHAIALFLRDICPWYRFYLRHNYTIDAEVVLYCQPMERIAFS